MNYMFCASFCLCFTFATGGRLLQRTHLGHCTEVIHTAHKIGKNCIRFAVQYERMAVNLEGARTMRTNVTLGHCNIAMSSQPADFIILDRFSFCIWEWMCERGRAQRTSTVMCIIGWQIYWFSHLSCLHGWRLARWEPPIQPDSSERFIYISLFMHYFSIYAKHDAHHNRRFSRMHTHALGADKTVQIYYATHDVKGWKKKMDFDKREFGFTEQESIFSLDIFGFWFWIRRKIVSSTIAILSAFIALIGPSIDLSYIACDWQPFPIIFLTSFFLLFSGLCISPFSANKSPFKQINRW